MVTVTFWVKSNGGIWWIQWWCFSSQNSQFLYQVNKNQILKEIPLLWNQLINKKQHRREIAGPDINLCKLTQHSVWSSSYLYSSVSHCSTTGSSWWGQLLLEFLSTLWDQHGQELPDWGCANVPTAGLMNQWQDLQILLVLMSWLQQCLHNLDQSLETQAVPQDQHLDTLVNQMHSEMLPHTPLPTTTPAMQFLLVEDQKYL